MDGEADAGQAMNDIEAVAPSSWSGAPQHVPGLSFDAVELVGAGRARRPGCWVDSLALGEGRLLVSLGELGGRDTRGVPESLREALGRVRQRPAAQLAAATAALRAFELGAGESALVALIDVAARTLTYTGHGYRAPFVRYADGSVAALPGDASPREATSSERPFAQVACDVRGATLLLLRSGQFAGSTGGAEPQADLRSVLAEDRLLDSARPAASLARRLRASDVPRHAALATVAIEAGAQTFTGGLPRWTASWTFEASAASSNATRRAFLDCLASKATADRTVDLAAAELIFGEMIGNVVRHAPGIVEIVLDWTGELPVLHVKDNGPGFRSRRRRERLPVDEFSESGRGLFIINACAVDFSVSNRHGRGTHARATLALAP